MIWCTGFRPDFSWIHLPVFDEAGNPKHVRGVVSDEPGLYFVGLLFLYAAVSDVLPGVGRDAEHIAKHIASRNRSALCPPAPRPESETLSFAGQARLPPMRTNSGRRPSRRRR